MKHRARTGAAASTLAAGLLLSACSGGDPAPAAAPAQAVEPGSRIALTYDGGLLVLDAGTLEVASDIELAGFNRVNPAGDGRNVFVTTEEGFRVLDTGAADSSDPVLRDLVFKAEKAGHVVNHAGRTVLYADGTGDTVVFETGALLDSTAALPATEVVPAPAPHHGVSLVLEDDTLLTTVGDEEGRTGVRVLDGSRAEVARNEDCPGVHGEGTAQDEVVLFGCEDGVLLYADGQFTKLAAPAEYGRTGNIYSTDSSPVAVGDYKADPDAEGYLLSAVVLVDTVAKTHRVVPLPEGVEYTWRGIGRGPDDGAVVLGSDGSLHLLDVRTGEVTASYPVIGAWESPEKWQDPHPALKVLDGVAYVTEPARNAVHAVDLATGEVRTTAELPATPNEIAIVQG